MRKIKIVIADDFAPVREIWKIILNSDERIEIVGECANGKEVLETLENVDTDVVLLDIKMSPINGFEASERIREKYEHVKILGISVHNDPSYAKRLMEIGAHGFIPKTSRKDEMIQAILQVYEGAHHVSEEVKMA
ncbi:MAG: response regulator transcription factor [Bacteroidetes bacterium]|nr:response regulator transcription factor [Bacteroidota bacterium]